MSSVLELARPELRKLRAYTPGTYEPGHIRLNANESPWRSPGDSTERGLNIYPPPRPATLRTALAKHYGTKQSQVLITRGSSEAIDVLIRGFCRAGQDNIVINSPTFDMYRVYAGIQNAEVLSVPLIRQRDFAVDTEALLNTVDENTKIVFLCSPNNPTGRVIPQDQLEEICESLAERCLIVIDEAYYEYAQGTGCLELCSRFEHVVLLRTMSKFVSLAGARCGALIAAKEIVDFLGIVLPPYTFPTPSIELVNEALATDSLQVSQERIALIKRERKRLAEALVDVPDVLKVYASDANFLLIETVDAYRFSEIARRAGILVRQFGDDPALANCIRITVGRPKDNDRLLQAVSGVEHTDEP